MCPQIRFFTCLEFEAQYNLLPADDILVNNQCVGLSGAVLQ